MSVVEINKKYVGEGHPCFVVAEIGINHNGSLEIAKKLIDVAVAAGCDAVKFQKRTVPAVYSQSELQKPREVPHDILVSAMRRNIFGKDVVARFATSNFLDTLNGDLKWALELTEDEYREIDKYCKEKNILWLASPWDEASVDFLEKLDVPCYKIASASLTDEDLLKHIRSKGKPVILSTGMSTMEELERAVEVLGEKDLIILHCVSTYPAKDEDLNLRAITTLKKRFPNVPIGYSGHEIGVSTSVMAAVLGADMVERHITLDRTMWGSDQAASLEPQGIALVARDIRKWENAKGDGIKRLLDAEVPIKQKLRRK
ncbi:N-acetylneuraminate synthase [Candidatus Giovannonibacteria bacterium RIFCSPLOWO2_01_FULL_43_160]|uniref:N-acetylneuraminate synthase n=2 Tax=Candidatus Giovannoniibacteriota TaxID=1752738 RepID=A0A0G1IWI7_9BACT|nr:MAG: N-acetylneuraminate synthase [Candidatus Giovannonibacteria bacterium GW2011_GWB1_43_13]KKS99558.1 MAG: N-acetylneuraminate synthase [Candidatus Giovannonibacteria bacterium GW2011_GWA1_43_15]KKT20723.1 MAG: N-acetylneuraminate synthase [Candidatus Giovannonibacteria bacterium GW2011_GWC2_43_8]KKT63455.1 MAG: N-acetylneuraminate synthase [Candidatus Giovannonibacteria bacterium GW2011_GWA2_44_26]OGF58109.1 MAG: N-acetylneuraminate synthase [Candidatus Giovannonibacteria bacterium RIFCSP